MNIKEWNLRKNKNLRMITNSTLHRTTSIVMLDPETNVGNQTSIIFWNGAFDLDFSVRNKKTLFEFGIQTENSRCANEVTIGCNESVHIDWLVQCKSDGSYGIKLKSYFYSLQPLETRHWLRPNLEDILVIIIFLLFVTNFLFLKIACIWCEWGLKCNRHVNKNVIKLNIFNFIEKW